MRAISLELLAAEAGVSTDLVERYVALGQLRPLADGRFDARDAGVLSTVNALLAAGTRPDDLEWAIESGRLRLSVVGHLFPDPPARIETYEAVKASLGPAGERLGPVYAAMGLPEPPADMPLRADEARVVGDFAGMWALVDPGGDSDVRVARLAGDGLRRLAEAWLDLWDAHAQPTMESMGAPSGAGAPLDPADPAQNPTVAAAAMSRDLVTWLFSRAVERTLHERIIDGVEGLLIRTDRMPPMPEQPPALAFVDLSGYTTLTEERGDEVAAEAAARLQEIAEDAARRGGGRVVKLLGDGVMLRFDDAATALGVTFEIVEAIEAAGLPPGHAGVAAGRVVVRDGDVFGRVVNLAARIAGEAGPGEIMVEEGVVAALADQTGAVEPIGRVELKGFAEPVAVWKGRRPAPKDA
ncbi:MAG TPA: adenylate/guanylate cyclase domain-containing protein [Methylomirabilota bacterium]|nr:adenylate/guanylate cyclase domain-containing protein [Methylomirabilota bacterium]